MKPSEPSLAIFASLPLRERLFVRGRLRTAPFDAVMRRVPERGNILDVGCGHGLLAGLLAADHPERTLLGIDPDERKIAAARLGPGRLPNADFRVATLEELEPRYQGSFAAVVVTDVLYLLPVAQWPAFLSRCRRLLQPAGRLLIKEAAASRSWKYYKCLAQEMVMVRLLRKTRSSGVLNLRPHPFWRSLLAASGFRLLEELDLSRGYSTPHVLFVAEPVP